MNNKKLLHIVGSMDPAKGGVTEAVNLITTGLERQAIQNDILSLDDPNAFFLQKTTKNIIALGLGKTPWQYNKQLDFWLKKHHKDYDTIILHGLWLYPSYALYKTILKKRNTTEKPKVYVMPHGMLDPYFQQAKGRRLKAWRNVLFWKQVDSKLIRSADGMLFTCEEERRLAAIPFKPYEPRQTDVVSIGLDKSSIQLDFPKHDSENKPYWLFLGRIHEKKGVDLLIGAYKDLSEKVVLPKLVIAGPGWDSDYGKKMTQLIDNQANIKTIPIVLGNEKWKLISQAELFILPSHQENFGITVIEALTCSTPVLITDKVNIFKEILDANAGICAQDNQESLRQKLSEWNRKMPSEKTKTEQNARLLFEQKFSLEKSTQLLMDAIFKKP